MNITAKIEVIGVKEAADYLQYNTNNRPIRQSHVDHLADEMLSGRWKFNGESIIFDDQGVLRNGQHRLTAILKARWRGISLWSGDQSKCFFNNGLWQAEEWSRRLIFAWPSKC